MKIYHLSHKLIDYELWDKSLLSSPNGLIYARSWYLDIVSPGWEALVSENYEYIFPVPVKRKYKIPYIVQPFLTQQLGLFSASEIDYLIIKAFINRLPSYSYELNINECNVLRGCVENPNYLLRLNNEYEKLMNSFSGNTIRNLKNAEKSALRISNELDNDEFTSFYQSIKKDYLSISSVMLRYLVEEGIKRNEMKLSGVYNSNNELIAANCLAYYNNRITNLIPISNEEGKKSSAMFLLINELIKSESMSDQILDFEGSKIEGIARFYKGFGAINQPYYTIKNLRPSFLVGRI
jgi:hypothetical protein